jgi:hypothetical protein
MRLDPFAAFMSRKFAKMAASGNTSDLVDGSEDWAQSLVCASLYSGNQRYIALDPAQEYKAVKCAHKI